MSKDTESNTSEKQKEIEELLERSRAHEQARFFEQRYVGATLSKLLPNADAMIHEKISKFTNQKFTPEASEHPMLVLIGPPGVGKTYICSAIVGWSVGRLHHRRVWREADLFSKLRKGMDQGHDFYEILEASLDDHLVIFDDLGANSSTDFRNDNIFNAIDIRYNTRLPTVVSTNLSAKEISERFHERLPSRLFASENIVIDFNGEKDLRQAGY